MLLAAQTTLTPQQAIPFTAGNIAFQALSFAVLMLYCLMIYRYRTQAAVCLAGAVKPATGDAPGAGKSAYDRFWGFAVALGAVSAGLAAVKAAAVVPGIAELAADVSEPVVRLVTALSPEAGAVLARVVAEPPEWVPAAAAGVVALGVVCPVALQAGVLRAAGALTLSRQFTDSIVHDKINRLAALSTLLVPCVAVWTGVNPARDMAIAYVVAALVVVTLVMFMVNTLAAFMKQKVSLLVWFLYLCIVEILPVCAIVAAAVQSI